MGTTEYVELGLSSIFCEAQARPGREAVQKSEK